MKIKLWGVRGSIPSPGPKTARYGGNTPCIELTDEKSPDDIVILEAGTGIRELGLSILASGRKPKVHILLSHTHWDHIHGLPFFTPLFVSGFEVRFYGPVHYDKKLAEILAAQMDYAYFPVRTAELSADISYVDLKEESFSIAGLEVRTQYMNHPVMTLGYRFTNGSRTFVYTGDNEPYSNFQKGASSDEEDLDDFVAEQNNRVVEFVRNAHLLVADSQYLESEYASKKGWGHSYVEHVVDMAAKGRVGKLILFHHEPERSDDQLEVLLDAANKRKEGSSHASMEVYLAKEKDIHEI